jgi:class 3 adenylate cyclase/tetratricopeptide (TPR) repeat protein
VDKFCGDCGHSLVQEASTAETDDLEPAQERRFVSVLFADLVGFTPFSEGRDHEEVRDFLTRFFEKASEVVERFGGTVDKYIGDALMAVWGAQKAEEDDAERAVRAALELVEIVAKLGAEIGEPDMALRVGVMTGETAVGPGGNRAGLIIGDLVNTASRLQSIADPNTVLVGEATFQVAGRAIEFEPLGEQTVKGKTAPVNAFRALRLVGMRGGQGRGDALEPPFVGRHEELRLLKDLLQVTARESRPRLVSIVGLVGVGKSRLAWEFKKYADGLVENIYWHEGRSPSYGEGVTFWALGEMVRGRAGITEGAEPSLAREKVREMLETYVPDETEREWLEPRLAGLLGLEEVPSGERGELFSAFRTFFERVADQGTTVLVFEDLHWADPGLLDFLEEFLQWSRSSPILILTLARPELVDHRPGWGSGRRDSVSLHLGPLSDGEIEELILGAAPGIDPDVVERVQERAAGVPLYAVELIRMLVNEGTLQFEGGVYRLTGDIGSMAVPESLHAVIGARLDRLDPEERDLVQNAAVLGQTFFVEGLAALTGSPEERLEPLLSGLVRKELLEIRRDPQSAELGQHGFVQGLIREVAYGRISRQDRRERHLRAARSYQETGDDEVAAIAASHYLAAYEASPPGAEADELAQLAVDALVNAAERAASLHSHEQALSLCVQALEMLPSQADQAGILELAVVSAAATAQVELADEYGMRLLEWQSLHGDARSYARAVWLYGRALLDLQASKRAVEILREVVTGEVDLGSDRALVSAAVELARALLLSGDIEEAVATSERGLIAAERLEMIPEITHAMITRGATLSTAGRLHEGSALLRGGLQLAIEHDLAQAELRARANLGVVAWRDHFPTVAEVIPPALEKARRIGDRSFEHFHAVWVVSWLRWSGELDKAMSLIEEYGETGSAWFDLSLEGAAGLIRLLRDDPGASLDQIKTIAEEARGLEDPQARADIELLLAQAYMVVGRLDESYQLAMEVFRRAPPAYEAGALTVAARAAVWAGEADRLRPVLAGFEGDTMHGRVLAGYRDYTRASLLALEGDTDEAAALFARLEDTWRHQEAPQLEAETQAAWALTCPQHPGAPAAAEKYRAFWGERGAVAVVDLFDRLYEEQLAEA